MKRVWLFIISFVCLSIVASSAQNKADTLRLMTYNLRFGELASMQQIGEYIASEAPDIVAVQECDWATKRKRAPQQNGVKFMNELSYYSGMFGSQSIMLADIMESVCLASILSSAMRECSFQMTARQSNAVC